MKEGGGGRKFCVSVMLNLFQHPRADAEINSA